MFCDDIRVEVGNKLSFMGVYRGTIDVPEFPYVAPKLCIATYCSSPIENTFKSLRMKISLGDTLLHDEAIPVEFINQSFNEVKSIAAGSSEPVERIIIGFNTMIAPLIIDRDSIIRVMVYSDEEEIVAGKIRIRQVASQ